MEESLLSSAVKFPGSSLTSLVTVTDLRCCSIANHGYKGRLGFPGAVLSVMANLFLGLGVGDLGMV